MSDLDTLVVTFQTQLSDVMETVVKTAMFEVTKLVEDVLMVEVKRRNQEVESLRMQLEWTERKFSDQAGKEKVKTGRCVDCARDDVELSAEERSKDQPGDMSRCCSVKKEAGERWMASCGQEVISESPQEAADPTVTQSPEREPPETEEEDMIAAVNMKEEEGNKPSCSVVRTGGWSGNHDGAASESDSEMIETQPNQPQENSETLLRNVIKQDPQISTAYAFSEDQQESHVDSEPTHASSFEMDTTTWAALTVTTAALLQNHRLEKDQAKSNGSVKATEHDLSNSVRADIQVTPGRDHISSSVSPKARLHSEALGVTIKEEVIIDSDGESEHIQKKNKAGIASFSCSVKQHKVSSGSHKLNHISHKATVQEVMKLHSKVGTGLRLQAAIQHLNRPTKKAPHTLSTSTAAAALSLAHSQVVNLNNLNRIPSTSKAAPPASPSVQRVHLGDKQTSPLNRAGAPWVSIKTQHQSVNSHHTNPALHPGSQLQAGPRHLLRCGQCGKCFPHPSNLKAHLQTHTGERPFCCSLCGRSFTKLSNLKAHRRVHTGERPYCCLACGKRFTQKCNLKRHQRIHLDV